VTRKEGVPKVTGSAQYVDDLHFEGMLYGVTVRSPVARGRIKEIRLEPGIPWNEFTVVTAKDIPGENYIALITNDQPCLADQFFNHAEEPILLLAHADKYLVEKARRAVTIDFDALPGVFTIEDSLAKKEVVWGADNVFKSYEVNKGNVDAAWSNAAFIVDGEYETGAQEQLYIEPQGVIARGNSEDGLTVWGSLQCPYYVHKALLPIFGLPKDRVRIIQTETGGGFGGKEEYPSMIAAHAALLAWKSGKPVKMIYDRAEDMVATTKRHPSRTRHRTALDRDGKFLAMDIDFTLDGGAYATLSSVVLSRGTIHAAGPYHCPNVRVRSRVVATNAPPHGAFRGFGAPQSIFALERHLDRVAAAVGLGPEELRRRNFIRKGQTLAVSQVVHEEVDMPLLMDRAFQASGYYEKRGRFTRDNADSPVKRGIGFAAFMHGAGFTGSGEAYLASEALLEATPEGLVRVLAGSTEMGQGTNTIFAQIAADALDLDCERIEVIQPDTAYVPNSGPTVASRTAMIVGGLVQKAAQQLRKTLFDTNFLQEGYDARAFAGACAAYIAKFGALKAFVKYQQPADVHWDDTIYQGDAYSAYGWAVYVAEVSVDARTAEMRVDNFTAVQDVGRLVNPMLAAGQVEGGVAQGIGLAIYENVVWKEGRMINGQMTNYIIPTSLDVPKIQVIFEEVPYGLGPSGAKGIGELPLDGAAPAVANAIAHATGLEITRVPITPEVLMELLEPVHA